MTMTEGVHERAHEHDLGAALADASPGLLRKLCEAAAAVGPVTKDARNEFHRYNYASAEAVLSATREELLSRGVLVIGAEVKTEERMRPTTSAGETAITTVHLLFSVFDADTGERLEIPWLGRGEDPMDKGISKALTSAKKTFLRELLSLPYGQDDPEADSSSDERAYGRPTVNLLREAKGLRDEQLNQILVANGLPAQAKPFGAFTRVPGEKADQIRTDLKAAHE
jgi:hypothetical protein